MRFDERDGGRGWEPGTDGLLEELSRLGAGEQTENF